MKLNPDLVRDLLLSFEKEVDFDSYVIYSQSTNTEYKRLKNYSHEEIIYHIRQCDLTGYLYNCKCIDGQSGEFSIEDLSPKGHEFLANIREDTVWNNVKSIASKVGAKSLSAFTQIATGVVTEIIKAQLRANGIIF